MLRAMPEMKCLITVRSSGVDGHGGGNGGEGDSGGDGDS